MSAKLPFNISILELTDETLKYLKPVTSLDTFEGSSKNFHDDGLFSVSIFGKVGDPIRLRKYSYIDTKVSLMHPIIFNTICEMKSLWKDILASKAYATWDVNLKDYVKTDQLNGQTGYAFFVSHWNELNLGEPTSEKRRHAIDLVNKYRSKAFTSKVVVMPAGLRDYEITDDGREAEDEFNALYRRLLSLSGNIHPFMVTPESIHQLDTLRYQMQVAFNNIYDKLKSMLEGKHKLIMGKWASRSVFNGTRNVISTTNIRTNSLNDPISVDVNSTVIGLYQYLKGTLPIAKHHIKAGFLSQVFPAANLNCYLTDPKTLTKKAVTLSPDVYDDWMSDEGLDRVISLYAEDDIRAKPIIIEDMYLGLIYKDYDRGVYRLFQDIEELPEYLDKKKVSPITLTELLYISVYYDSHTYPCFVTRYPITGFGSIYPSYAYLKPTVVTQPMRQLDSYWVPDETVPLAKAFPVGVNHYNSLSPSAIHLVALGADFDGDTCSCTFVYTKEAMEEVQRVLSSRNYYVNTSGNISFSSATDTVNYLTQCMTADAA